MVLLGAELGKGEAELTVRAGGGTLRAWPGSSCPRGPAVSLLLEKDLRSPEGCSSSARSPSRGLQSPEAGYLLAPRMALSRRRLGVPQGGWYLLRQKPPSEHSRSLPAWGAG